MRGALIHGVLLAVMLVYGYRTWTRDKNVGPDLGSVSLWDKSENDLVSIEYKQETKIVKLERKGDYWWGTEVTIERKPKPKAPDAAGSGSAGSAAGSGSAGSGSAATPPPVEYEETGRKSREWPVGEAAEKLVKNFAAARALRDLGKPNDDQKKEYKLDTAKTTMTVTFKDGPHTFLIGGSVYGGADKYAVDQQTGKAYVLSRDLVSTLEIGESSLHLTDPRGFDAAKIESVTIEAGSRSKQGMRVQSHGTDGKEVKTWGDADTKKPNQTLANFIDNANNLKPTEYDSTLKPGDLAQVMKLTYKDERGGTLGTLTVYKHEKAGTLPEGQDLDPANPPKGELEYFIMTEKTRVPGLVRKDTAQRAENDIDTVMNSKGTDEPAAGSGSAGGPIPGKPVEPKGNPFGPVPKGAIPPGGGPPPAPPMPGGPNPHGPPAPPMPGGPNPHGAAPAPAPAPTPAPAPAPKAPAPAAPPAGHP
jgi:hypothetical protein